MLIPVKHLEKYRAQSKLSVTLLLLLSLFLEINYTKVATAKPTTVKAPGSLMGALNSSSSAALNSLYLSFPLT